jgi:hypothetical protein
MNLKTMADNARSGFRFFIEGQVAPTSLGAGA